MTKLIWLVVATFAFSHGTMKADMETAHGKEMIVSYLVLNSGKHSLMVTRSVPGQAGKPSAPPLQTVELNMKKNEVLSLFRGFRCTTKADEFVYAVISKSHAKEKETFRPERAWSIDEKNLRLNPIARPSEISCVWSPDGDGKFPFK